MIYTEEITKDLVTQMIRNRQAGKSIDQSAKATTRYLNNKHKVKLNWGSVRSKFYDAKPRKPKTIERDEVFDVRQKIIDLMMTRENVTLEIRGKEIHVVFK